MPRARIAVVLLACAVPLALAAGQATPTPPPEKLPSSVPHKSLTGAARVDLSWGLKVPLRDGVKLSATMYRPKDVKEALPVICTITPYIADNYHDRGVFFAANGYIFVSVDSRGRGNSEGGFEPFTHEGRDGYDVVEWLAVQPWCNGKVGLWGGSYAGCNQWAILKECPPHLTTIVPVASAYPGVDFPAPGGIFHAYFLRWLTMTSGTTLNQKLFAEDAFWIARFRERYLQHTPFQDLDVLVGNPSRHYQKWFKHRMPDAYWDAMVPAPEDYARMDMPILTITGHFDDDQPGALEFYRRHARHGSKKGFEQHYLIMGPWDHSGTRTPVLSVGGVTFSMASLVDMNRLHKEWYDWTLKGQRKSVLFKSRVHYYLTGAEHWKDCDSLEAIGAKARPFYIGSPGGQANDVFHSGTLSADKPGAAPPDRYTYDPLDVRPAELETHKIENFLTDQRHALNLNGNGLVYHSEPLERPLNMTGQMRFVAWVALDVPDTDLQVSVSEILPNGTNIALGDDRIRARFRESLRAEKLAKPGEICCYEFKNFYWTSRRLGKGSRLRVVVQSPNSIYLEKNYNSGKALGTETKTDARTAHVSLYHDTEHPSFLELPEAPEPPPETVLPKKG